MSWPALEIGQLVNKGDADIQTGPFGTQLKASDYMEHGVPVINVRNIGYSDLRPEKIEYITESKSEQLGVHKLENNDIVFGRKGAVDRHLYVKNEQVGWIQGSDCIRLRFSSEEINPRFVSYSFLSSYHKQWMLNQCGNKATMASLNQDVVKRILIKLPSKTHQDIIVEVLQKYDDLIENNKRRIELLEESARQLYKEWFVRFRFPGHEHVKIIDGVPEGWELKKLEDLFAKIKRTGKIKKEEYVESGAFPCVDQSQSFIGGYTDNHEAIIKEPLPLVIFGDHTRILKFVDFPFACGADGTQILYPNDDRLSIEYFYFSLLNVDLSNYFYARHFKFLKDQEILIPPERHVKAFTEFACSNMKQISKLRDQCLQLSKARDLLLPKLMSGEIAV